MSTSNPTAQEIFDQVLTHLRVQGCQSIKSAAPTIPAMCLYRGPNGTRCAIGVLIPDDLYRPNSEGRSVDELIDSDGLPAALTPHRDLLSDLQWLHDTDSFWSPKGFVGEGAACDIAAAHALIYTPPEDHIPPEAR